MRPIPTTIAEAVAGATQELIVRAVRWPQAIRRPSRRPRWTVFEHPDRLGYELVFVVQLDPVDAYRWYAIDQAALAA